MESVVSDTIAVLEGRDVLWASVMFPAAEIRALEDPCRKWGVGGRDGGAPAQQGPGHHTLAMPIQCKKQGPCSLHSIPDADALLGLRPLSLCGTLSFKA